MEGNLFEETIQAENAKREKCFVITPIGNETDPIRRHIDGIIEAAIRPAFEGKYDVVASHTISQPGTITKQIIQEIYEDKLAVVNLTNNNPNVMYELALRYCIPKPVILIAVKGTKLPSDVLLDRTIFYEDDAQGGLDLKRKLVEAEEAINFSKAESPVYDVLHELGVENSIISNQDQKATEETTPLRYILKRLDAIDGRLERDLLLKTQAPEKKKCIRFAYFYEKIRHDVEVKGEPLANATNYVERFFPEVSVQGFGGIPGYDRNIVYIDTIIKAPIERAKVSQRIKESLEADGYTGLVDCILPTDK